MVGNDLNYIFVVENINITEKGTLLIIELPAVESRHAMGDFEKPQVSLNFSNYVYFF